MNRSREARREPVYIEVLGVAGLVVPERTRGAAWALFVEEHARAELWFMVAYDAAFAACWWETRDADEYLCYEPSIIQQAKKWREVFARALKKMESA